MITIKDWGRAEYLDGARMRYVIVQGVYPSETTIAYVNDLDIARKFAQVLDDMVIIEDPS